MKAMAALLTLLALSGCRADEQPSPSSEIEVPVSRLSSDEARERGRALFVKNCAICHGKRADGRGPRSRSLARRPTDFTSAHWRARTDASEIFRVLNEGVRGTSMPAWPTLSDDQKWDVIAYVLGVAEGGP